MSSDEYALALAQKYRLAISMAVLKTKPENLTINEYINEIKHLIIDRNKDTSQQDLDMTACSDDFNIDDDDDDEIMKIDLPQDFKCDQDVKSVSNDPRNDTNNSYHNKLQHNEMQIGNDYKIDDKLTDGSHVNDKVIIHLNEGDIENIVIGTQNDCTKRQLGGHIKQYNNNKTQDTANSHQNVGNIVRSYEKSYEVGIRTKVNSKGIEMSGDKTQDIDMTQGNNRLQEYENKTQITDTNIGEAEKSDPNKERRDKFREVIRILKGVDVPIEKFVKEKHIPMPGIIKLFDPTDLDLTQCYDNTNDNFLHMDRLADADCQSIHVQDHKKIKHSNNYNNMVVCNSITTSNVPDKDRQEARKRKTGFDAHKHTNTDAKSLKITKTDDTDKVKINPRNSIGNNTLYYAIENNHKEANNKGQNEVHFGPKTTILGHERINHMEVSKNTVIHKDIDPVGVINTQDTQSNTHYSESQMFDIVIDKNLIYGNRNQNFGLNAETNKLIDRDCGDTNQENIEDRKNCIFTHKTKDLPKSQNVTNNTSQNEFAFMTCQDAFPRSQEPYSKIDNCTENGIALSFDTNDIINIQNNTEFRIDIVPIDIKTVKDLHEDKNNVTNKQMYQIHTEREDLIENNTAFSKTQDKSLTQSSLISTQVNEYNKNNDLDTIHTENVIDCTDFDKSKDIDVETTEKVPFKILEEMNQIKLYLSKKREFKDSGYKSSQSQRSGIITGTQPSSVRVGESADSIYIYLFSCPLDVTTRELTEQISEVLGQIIDRLHEEEIYPKFLEELLITVEKLLHLVYEQESNDFDVLQKKDEQIQRIILLNQSSHINKFTIEKINIILQKLTDEISDTNYEIQEINKLENLCYVFHILQIILPKYIHGKLYNSQLSQTSQEQKVLKKQDISDIWRRKWFSNTEKDENEGSLENKCVLKECSAILNKIIVNFMDGYSLIAFSALKCFNLIQL